MGHNFDAFNDGLNQLIGNELRDQQLENFDKNETFDEFTP